MRIETQMATVVVRNLNERTTWRLGCRCIAPLCFYLAGAALFFRFPILSQFDLMFGNAGDARFVVFIHEHVFRWLSGGPTLVSPPFFFDQPGTLGYSDAFLLDQLVYSPFRWLGFDPFLS